MSSTVRPLVEEYSVQRFWKSRASPCSEVPANNALPRSTNRQEISLAGDATAEIFPARNENKPPPSVPIQRFPCVSSARARTAFFGRPSPLENVFHSCPSKLPSPFSPPTHSFPSRPSKSAKICRPIFPASATG